MVKKGLAIYFFDDTIHVFEKTMEELQYPKHIHIFINSEAKLLYVRSSLKRDNNTFKVNRKKENTEWRYRIFSKDFVKYLASLIGVHYPSNSIWLEGILMEDGKTVQIDLSNYHVIPYRTEL